MEIVREMLSEMANKEICRETQRRSRHTRPRNLNILVFSFGGWHTLLSHASAEACLTGWPNAQAHFGLSQSKSDHFEGRTDPQTDRLKCRAQKQYPFVCKALFRQDK